MQRQGQVPAPYLAFLIAASHEHGIDAEDLLETTGLSRSVVDAIDGIVAWDSFMALLARWYEVSRPEQRRAILREYAREYPAFAVIAAAAANPCELMLAAIELVLPAFPALRARVRRLRDRRIELRLEARRGFEPTPALFGASALLLEVLPGAMGKPDAEVQWESTESAAVYRIRTLGCEDCQSSRSAASRAVGELVSTVQSALGAPADPSPPRSGPLSRGPTLVLQQAFGLTRAEARVAVRLARGLSPRQIAAELGVSVETVRSHLKQSYSKVGVRRQAELVAAVVKSTREPLRVRAR